MPTLLAFRIGCFSQCDGADQGEALLAQLEQLGGDFYDFTITDASQIKGLDCARP
jgi:hypothetical protein